MATRSTAVGSLGVGSYETYANYNDGAGGLIGYARSSTSQTGITGLAYLTAGTAMTLVVTPSSATRILRIGYSFNIVSTVGNDNCQVKVEKDGSIIDIRVFTNSKSSGADATACASSFCIDVAPTAASHTYRLQFGQSGTSSGTWSTQASSTQLTSMYIWDDGPSF